MDGLRLPRLRATFVSALAVIMLFALGQAILLGSLVRAQQHVAEVLKFEGSMRVLSQRIAFLALEIHIGHDEPAARAEMETVLAAFHVARRAVTGTESESLLVQADAYAANAQRVLHSRSDDRAYVAIQQARVPIFVRLDASVKALQRSSTDRSVALLGAVGAAFLGMIASIWAAWQYLLLPAEQRIGATSQLLAEHRQRLSSLFDHHPDAMVECDRHLTILRVNAAAGAVTGRQPGEQIGNRFGRNFVDELAGSSGRFLERALSGTPVRFETRLRRGNGDTIDIACSLIPSVADGNVVGVYGMMRDITTLRAAQRDVLESQQRLQSLFEQQVDGVIAIDLEKRYVMVNAAVEEISGYRACDLIGESVSKLVAPELVDWIGEKHQAAIEGRPAEYDAIMIRKDGTRLDVQAKAFRMLVDNRPVGLYVILRDVSQQHKIERRITEQHQQFRSLFEQNPDAVVALNLDGRFSRVNIATELMTGYFDYEILGEPFTKLVAPDRLHDDAEQFAKLASGEPTEINSVLRRKDGRQIEVAGRSIPIVVESAVRGTYVVLKDVTEQRRIERSERALVARTLEDSRLKTQFVAMMSHEIRTPLNAMIGMTELLAEAEQDALARDRAVTIHQSAETLLAIVNDVLDFSKIEAGRMEREGVAFAPRELVHQMIDTYAASAQAKHLSLTCELSDDIPEIVIGDVGKLRQVLVNLVANGIKFTAAGSVRIHGRVESKDDDNVVLRFEVSDTGVGIASITKPRLFSPFMQADGSTRRRFGGTGLGLSICKGLVELMHGTIDVESDEDNGSTFWFTARFERVRASQAPTHADDRAELPPAPLSQTETPLRILVVEDHPVNRKIADQQLRRLGHAPDFAVNGREAIDVTERVRYDIVFMDCHMPEVDGYEATRRIRSREARGGDHVQIVAMTANALDGERETCLAVGMDDYLAKPIRLADLRDAIGRSRSAALSR